MRMMDNTSFIRSITEISDVQRALWYLQEDKEHIHEEQRHNLEPKNAGDHQLGRTTHASAPQYTHKNEKRPAASLVDYIPENSRHTALTPASCLTALQQAAGTWQPRIAYSAPWEAYTLSKSPLICKYLSTSFPLRPFFFTIQLLIDHVLSVQRFTPSLHTCAPQWSNEFGIDDTA